MRYTRGEGSSEVDVNIMAETVTVRTLEDFRKLRPQIMALARQCRAREVSVYGSIARGEMHADSDIDFLVDFESKTSLLDLARLTYSLEDLLGRKVDVVPRRALREELKPYAQKALQSL